MKALFSRFARAVSAALGTPYAFALAVTAVVVWAALGPAFDFSEKWQLIINTGTTIVTFLVVFLIQTSQNRDAKAVHLKLDELVHVISKARNQLIDCEELTDTELARLEEEFRQLRNSPARKRGAHAPKIRHELEEVRDAK
jgi:low affinity Fe/Cu permease